MDFSAETLQAKRERDDQLGEQTCGCDWGKEGGNGMVGNFGVGGCKLSHLEWRNTGVLWYSTGNSV